MTKNGPDLTECVKSGPFCINARLFLERVARDTAALQGSGVQADLNRQEKAGEILLTVRILPSDK